MSRSYFRPLALPLSVVGLISVVIGAGYFTTFRKSTPTGPSVTRNIHCFATTSGGTVWCVRENGTVYQSGATVVDGITGVAYSPSTIEVCSGTGDVLTVGDGKLQFFVPMAMSGYNLLTPHAGFAKAGRTGNSTFQINNRTKGKRDMLSTVITVESTESGSHLATTPPVVNAANDDVGAFDNIWIDVDSASTGIVPQGVCVQLPFSSP